MKGKSWNLSYDDAPWFDQPDALDRIERGERQGRYDSGQASLLRKWVEDGYFALSDVVPHALLDGMAAELETLWWADRAIPGLKIEEVRIGPDDPPGLLHEQLVALPRAERL